MVQNSFEAFRDLVLADEELQQDLRRFSNRGEFVKRIVEMGQEHDFQFTADEIEEEMRLARRVLNEHPQ